MKFSEPKLLLNKIKKVINGKKKRMRNLSISNSFVRLIFRSQIPLTLNLSISNSFVRLIFRLSIYCSIMNP